LESKGLTTRQTPQCQCASFLNIYGSAAECPAVRCTALSTEFVVIRYVFSERRRQPAGNWWAAGGWLRHADAAHCHGVLRHQVSFLSVILHRPTAKLTDIV